MVAFVLTRRPCPCFCVRGCNSQSPHYHNNKSHLEKTVKAKVKALEAELRQTSAGQLQAMLSSVQPKSKPFLLLERLINLSRKGFTAIIVEVDSSDALLFGKRCSQYVDAIAVTADINAIAVPHLTALSAAVTVPVIVADWILHPIQIAQTAEAGASAVRMVYAVLKKGTAAILRYTQALGLDAIVEVVNLKELEEVATLGVSAYGINLSVGLSLPIPGFRKDIAKSLLGNIPFGSYSIVGVSSQEEALEMRLAGADAVYIKQEVLERYKTSGNSQEQFLQNLRESLTGDD